MAKSTKKTEAAAPTAGGGSTTADVVQRLMDLFAGFESVHGTHGQPAQKVDSVKWEIRSTAKTLRQPVTRELWEAHLAGKRPLGVIPIREDGMCRWGSIDYDVYDEDLDSVIARVEEAKLPLLPGRSKSGGLHLWLFLSAWTPAADVQAALSDIAARLGISGSEVYPKQTAIMVERGDLGSWMVMPYYGDTFDGKLQWQFGLKRGGMEMSLEEFVGRAEDMRVSVRELASVTRKKTQVSRPKQSVSQSDPGAAPPDDGGTPFGDGPPCLEALSAQKIGRGHQNNALLMMGVYYKKRNPGDWRERLGEASRTFLNPAGSYEGTASVVRSLEKKDYNYTCKAQPMCDYCSVALCRTRRFGVGGDSDYPSLSSLRVLHSDPPIFFMEVDGKVMEFDDKTLFDYRAFNRHVAGKRGKFYAAMKQVDWETALKVQFDNSEPLPPPPPDITRQGMFFELLEEFLTSKLMGERLEDCFSGRPYKDAEKNAYVFRMRDLMNFLYREGLKDLNRAQVSSMVKELDGDKMRTTVHGKTLHAWQVPATKIEDMPQLPTPARGKRGSEI